MALVTDEGHPSALQVKPQPPPLTSPARPTHMRPKICAEALGSSPWGLEPPAGDERKVVPDASLHEFRVIEDAKHFFRDLQTEAENTGVSVPEVLTQRYGSTPAALKQTRARMLEVIPWMHKEGYICMLSTPRFPRMTGRVHVAMLSFHPAAYHANGLYCNDVMDKLDIFHRSQGPKFRCRHTSIIDPHVVDWCFVD